MKGCTKCNVGPLSNTQKLNTLSGHKYLHPNFTSRFDYTVGTNFHEMFILPSNLRFRGIPSKIQAREKVQRLGYKNVQISRVSCESWWCDGFVSLRFV